MKKFEGFNKKEEIVEEKGKEKEVILTEEQRKAKEEMIQALSKGWVADAIEIKERSSVPEEVISSPEIQQAAKE
ncbi:MAG: hypothetical protein AAB475_00950, partial [Patescibacteria group bacterium]